MVHIFEAIKKALEEKDLPPYTKSSSCLYPSAVLVAESDGTERVIEIVTVSKDTMYHLNSLLRYKETTLLNGRAGIHRLAWDQRPNIYDVQEKFGYSRFEPAPTNQAWQSSFLTKQQQENFLVKFWRRLPIIPRRLILEFVGTVHPQRVVLTGRPQHLFPPPVQEPSPFTDMEHDFLAHFLPRLPIEFREHISGFSHLPNLIKHRIFLDISRSRLERKIYPTACSEHTTHHTHINQPVCSGSVKYQASAFMFASKGTLQNTMELLGHNMLTIERGDSVEVSESSEVVVAESSREGGENVGQLVNLIRDMLVFHGKCSELWSAKELHSSLLRLNAAQKVKSVAISIRHRDYMNILASLKHYPNLELVFIVITDEEERLSERRSLLRRWTNNHLGSEHRISQRNELMYEDLGCSPPEDSRLDNANIFRKEEVMESGLSSCKTLKDIFMDEYTFILRYDDPRTMTALMHALSREVNGKLACPVIRFVRQVTFLED